MEVTAGEHLCYVEKSDDRLTNIAHGTAVRASCHTVCEECLYREGNHLTVPPLGGLLVGG